MSPALGSGKKIFGGDVAVLIAERDGFNTVGKEHAATAAMEFQLLDSFSQPAETLEELVFILAREAKIVLGAIDEEKVAERADHRKKAEHDQHAPGEPAEIRGATQEKGDVDRNNGNGQKSLGDIQH